MFGSDCQNGRMTAKEPLILYSRPGCHLCELAAEMLDRLAVDWREVDIETDPELDARYGLVIPVVRSGIAKKELPFPFGEEQLSRFVKGLDQ